MAKLDSEQRKVVRAIKREGQTIRDRKTRRLFEHAAVQTGLVEYGLRNRGGGDQDSTGWRQERAQGYADDWAKTGGPLNLKASVKRFKNEFLQHYTPGEHSYDVAAQVQRPREDLRGRYREESGKARQILEGWSGQRHSGGGIAGRPDQYRTVPGVDNLGERQALMQGYLAERGKPNALLNLKAGLDSAQDVPSRQVLVKAGQPRTPKAQHQHSHGGGKVSIRPGADRAGVSTNRKVVRFVKEVSSISGLPVEIGTGTNHSQMTVSGNVSQHWTGDAADIPATGKTLIKLGRAALIAAGMPRSQARKAKGGLYNVNGRQIIFATNEGGNHHGHLHVGL